MSTPNEHIAAGFNPPGFDQPTATATPRTDLRKLLRVLLNKAHTQGQDDYRQGASHSSVTRHGEEFNAAEDAMCRAIDTLERELSSAQAALAEAKAEVARLKAIDVPPQTIGDGTSAGPLSVFARGWNGYINTLREMHPTIQFREGCIDTSGRFHGDMSMADVNASLRAELKAVRKQANDEFDAIITRNMELEQDKAQLTQLLRNRLVEVQEQQQGGITT